MEYFRFPEFGHLWGGGINGAPNPLLPYYSDLIALHYNPDAETGPVTRLRNFGYLGSSADAPVAGTPVPKANKMLQSTATSGYYVSGTRINLVNRRLLWVMAPTDQTTTMRVFGTPSTGGAQGYIRTSNGTTMQIYRNPSPQPVESASVAIPLSTGYKLYELFISSTGFVRVYLNGTFVGSASGTPWSLTNPYEIQHITAGDNPGFQQYVGGFGDLIAVQTGPTGWQDAVNASRAYLAAKFGITVSVPPH